FNATATAGTATAVVVTTAPSANAGRGVPFAQQPVLHLEDANGNAVAQAGVNVQATVTAGAGTPGGTATVATDASGVATFTDLSIDGGVGAHTLSFDAATLTGVTANLVVTAPPTGSDDTVAGTSAPGNDLHTALNTALVVAAAGTENLLANDDL